jgi:hypothetical protein
MVQEPPRCQVLRTCIVGAGKISAVDSGPGLLVECREVGGTTGGRNARTRAS